MTTTIPDPYTVTTLHEKPLDWATVQAVKDVESRLGYELTIYQGIGDAAASANTHSKGRCVDFAPYDWKRKVRVLRNVGFAAWHRPYNWDGRGGIEHIHAVLIFPDRQNQKGIASTGYAQIGKYDRREDGLAGSRPDPNQYRPKPVTQWSLSDYQRSFNLPPQKPVITPISKTRDAITEAHHSVAVAIRELKTAKKPHPVQVAALRAVRGTLRGALSALPKK